MTELGRVLVELPLHPRLARMLVQAAPEDRATAAMLAAVLTERDVASGVSGDTRRRRDRAARGARARGTGAGSAGAVATVRRRSEELLGRFERASGSRAGSRRIAREARTSARADPGPLSRARFPRSDRPRALGFALPPPPRRRGVAPRSRPPHRDRVDRRRRGRGRRWSGIGRRPDPPCSRDRRTGRRGDRARRDHDGRRSRLGRPPDDLRQTTVRTLDALVLEEVRSPVTAGPETARLLSAHAARGALSLLGWTAASRALQARKLGAGDLRGRVAGRERPSARRFGRGVARTAPSLGDREGRPRRDRPGAGDPGAPRWTGSRARPSGPEGISPPGRSACRDRLRRRDRPRISVRAQDLYGLATHPTVALGRARGDRRDPFACGAPDPGDRRSPRILAWVPRGGEEGDGDPVPEAPLAPRIPRHRTVCRIAEAAGSAGRSSLTIGPAARRFERPAGIPISGIPEMPICVHPARPFRQLRDVVRG